MSASREKKQRQGELGKELTQKQRQELQEKQAAKRKAVLYTVIGVIAAVLVVILLVWHSGIFQRRATAASVGDHNFTVTDVEYYFSAAMTEEYYNVYLSTGSVPFDPTGDLREQFLESEDEDAEPVSYYDYFMEQALVKLTQTVALEDAANQEGFTLSQEDAADLEASMESLRSSAEQSGYPNLASYLKANVGRYMTVNAYRDCLERDMLVTAYQQAYADSQEITDADLQAYYEEHAANLDSYEYRYILVSGAAASTTDEEGNTVEPTE